MEQIITIIEVADNLVYAIEPITILAAGAALKAISGGVNYGKKSKLAKEAKKNANEAAEAAALASAELAARERRSFVPGFTGNDFIPGYTNDMLGPQPGSAGIMRSREGGGIFTTTDPLFQGTPYYQHTLNPSRSAAGGFQGLNPYKNPAGFYGDMDVVGGPGYGAGEEIRFDEGGNILFNENAIKYNVAKTLRANPEFMKFTKSLPKTKDGRIIAPDPNTKEGKSFYSSLPKSVAEMIQDPNYAQMYKGSNIVNPYANVVDLSRIYEDVSGIATDRTSLLKDRSGMFKGGAELLTDLAAGERDLSKGFLNLSEGLTNLRRGAEDYSGLATDTSILASNPYSQLQVATQAADLQAQQTDQALANTLSTIKATGAGAGGATAIAQAALQSKLGISAVIEQQEARNVELRAQGQQQIESIKMSEGRRLQEIAFAERLRLETLRQSEGLRLDTTRLDEGRALRDLQTTEGRELRNLRVLEGRRLQEQSVADRLRQQELEQGEALRLQQSAYGEAGRIQDIKMQEQLRLQTARYAEQQRLQEADAMGREYQFRVAETREQNQLNRLAGMETQKAQTAADLEAARLTAEGAKAGALVGAIGGLGEAALSYAEGV